MKRIKCYDKNGNSVNHLIQWDKNQVIYVDDLENGITPRVHFSIKTDKINCWEFSEVVSKVDAMYKIKIPNSLLDKGSDLVLFLYYDHNMDTSENTEPFTTECYIHMPVIKKPMPDGFIYSDNVEYVDVHQLKKYIDDKYGFILSQKGIPDGVAELDRNGHIPSEQLPEYVVSVEKSEKNGNIKIDGKEVNIYTHPEGANPHGLTASDLGLEKVNNTADIDKPVSTATQAAIEKVDTSIGLVDTKVDETNKRIDQLISDGLSTDVEKLKDALRDIFYPIGTIYESVNSTNPSEFIGGTWVSWGAGKVSVGVDTSQTEFSTVEKTGGEKTHTLSAGEMPSHNHSFTGKAVTSGTQSANHTHSIPALSGTAATVSLEGGAWNFSTQNENGLSYNGIISSYPAAGGTARYGGGETTSGSNGDTLYVNATHSHTVSTNASNTGSNSANHTHSVTASGTIGNTGENVAHNNLQPYITSYKWKRTA